MPAISVSKPTSGLMRRLSSGDALQETMRMHAEARGGATYATSIYQRCTSLKIYYWTAIYAYTGHISNCCTADLDIRGVIHSVVIYR